MKIEGIDLTFGIEEEYQIINPESMDVVRLLKLYCRNQSWRTYRRHHIVENKWRAMRYGIEDKLIDFGQAALVSAKALMLQGMEKDLKKCR